MIYLHNRANLILPRRLTRQYAEIKTRDLLYYLEKLFNNLFYIFLFKHRNRRGDMSIKIKFLHNQELF